MAVPVESLMRAVSIEDGYLVFQVAVATEAERDRLVLQGDELVFETSEPELRGRPEAALVRLVSRALGAQPGLVEVERPRGFSLLRVKVRLQGLDPEEALRRLAGIVEAP